MTRSQTIAPEEGAFSDVIIIGAGLLGSFLARSLRRYNLSVTVLEKENDVMSGISRSGSGIIYAGYDMKPGTVKARMTVSSCRAFPDLCRTLGVRFKNCGSLMVSFSPEADKALRKKYDRGLESGVPGLRLLDSKECLAMEPILSENVSSGLYAPGTCVVNPWELGIAACENAAANGAVFLLRHEVTDIRRILGGFLLTASGKRFSCRVLVNCAGLSADTVHELVSPPSVRLSPSSADYLLLEDSIAPSVSHVIFYETGDKSKGLTLVPTTDGNVLVGQTERDGAFAGDPTSPEGLMRLSELCRTVVPELPVSRIMKSFGTARPNPYLVKQSDGEWVPSDDRLHDFQILEEDGFFSLIGIKTPGLTCSAALADLVAEKTVSLLGQVRENPGFRPERPMPAHIRDLREEDRMSLTGRDPSYGRIVCQCRGISEGELRDAVRRGARTLEGAKRRCGVLMGNCQGSRCLMEVLEIMADELQIRPEDIPGGTGDIPLLR